MLYSILQIIAFQALFLLVYDLFLKRETFFNYNRAYLLVSSVLSLVLPFIKFPELKKMATENIVIQLPEVFIGTKAPSSYEIQIAEQAGIIIEQPQTPIWQSVLLIGIVVASLFFLFKITKLYWLKHRNPKRWQGNVLIVKLIKSSAAFSFFNTIFLGERIPESEKLTIYKHELVHIKELHTLDLLFFELLRIVFWFNPLVYIYQNRIKELHEYIADANAVKQNGKSAYYESLLNQVFDVNNVSFTNTFFKKSLIKKRITMLQKSKSKQPNLIKYALLIPLVFGMLIYTSTEVRAQQKIEAQEKVVDQELTDEELVKKYFDEFVKMGNEGSKFKEIMDLIRINRNDKYIESREYYLRFIAFGQYIRQMSIEMKSEKGTLTQSDIDRAEEMKSRKYKSYAEYRDWKKTDEAKELWELNTQDGVLKLVVKDLGNQTEEEKKRFDGLMKQLEVDDFFKKLLVCEARGGGSLIIDSPNNPHPKAEETLKVVESIEVPFSVIDEVPTLKECEDLPTNNERKKCMNQFVNIHVNKNFNIKLADSLSPGRKRIFVSFKIDKEGKVKNIQARGPSAALEEEAKRVINTLPQFVPGRQKGELVVVPYSIPIVFQVADKAAEEMTKTHNELVAQRDRVLKNSSERNPVVVQLNNQIEILKYEKLKGSLEAKKKDLPSTEGNRKQLVKYMNGKLNKVQKDSLEIEEVPFSVVEVAPVHKDCKSLSTHSEQKKCTNAVVNKLINKNFNTNLAKSLDLSPGRKQIFAQFIIDEKGNVTNIGVRGPHPKLKEETIRVLKLLPQFIPGKQDGKVVKVPFSLPIVFQIADLKKN